MTHTHNTRLVNPQDLNGFDAGTVHAFERLFPTPPTPAATPGRLLRIGEVAKRLDIATRTIWRWVALGKLPQPIRFTKVCLAGAVKRLKQPSNA